MRQRANPTERAADDPKPDPTGMFDSIIALGRIESKSSSCVKLSGIVTFNLKAFKAIAYPV